MAFNPVSTGLASKEQAFTNCCFVHPDDLVALAEAAGVDPKTAAERGVLCAVGQAVFFVRPFERQARNTIGVGNFQKSAGTIFADKPTPVSPFKLPPSVTKFPMSQISMEVDVLGDRTTDHSIDASEVVEFLRRTFNLHVFKVGQVFAANFVSPTGASVPLKLKVTGFELLEMAADSEARATGTGGAGGAGGASPFGQFLKSTEVGMKKAAEAVNLKLTGSSSGKGTRLFEKGFNFEALGIGGLNREFADIFRRAFASRVMPPEILKKMGQKHVRGMLLYGPPGCGKTLIARQIGKALHARPPKIVNGPEVFDKYVGESERKIRDLFADAEKEQEESGDDSELHIIIFDEFDAICRQRGSVSSGTGVNDSIVNQLLSKIDGVESLNNVLIIGMTNRKDMIDEAVLRPGRLEVHVEIGLPDEEGRSQILNIHTAALRHNPILGSHVSIPEIAAHTMNYTGAELEGLVKTAVSYVFQRHVDMADLKVKGAESMVCTRDDFMRALDETSPMFGVKEDELERLVSNGIINTGVEFESLMSTLTRLTHQVKSSDRSPLVSVVLSGPASSGKSAIAARVAIDSGFPFVKRISGESLLSLHEAGKADAITRTFNDAHKSPLSLIILDDLERLIEFVPVGQRFSNAVLQTLLVLVKALPPPGRRLFVLATTACEESLEGMGLMSSFQLVLPVPVLSVEEQFLAVFKATGAMEGVHAAAAAERLRGKHLGIKRLLTMIEMARQADEDAEMEAEALSGGAAAGGAGTPSTAVVPRPRKPFTADRFIDTMFHWML